MSESRPAMHDRTTEILERLDAIEQLLAAKQGSAELAWGPRVPALSDWIAAELARLESGPLLESTAKPDPALLDRTFRDWLES